MRHFIILSLVGFVGLGLSEQSSDWPTQNVHGELVCEYSIDCPYGATCTDGSCISSYGGDIGSIGCPCCACEACVCERLPKCCSQYDYWDEDCIALCGGECGGYALDPDDVDCDGKVCGWDGCFGSCGTCGPGLKCVDGACEPCIPDCEGKECGPDGCGGICGWCDLSDLKYCQAGLYPDFPEPGCYQAGSIKLPDKGCCVSDSIAISPDGEHTCAEGFSCRWGNPYYPYYEDDIDSWRYDCFSDDNGVCPEDYAQSNCLVPETWKRACCAMAPYAEFPQVCDFTPHSKCNEYLECGPDGVGGVCGTCADGYTCVLHLCKTCTPSCDGKTCGDDNCGGACGECSAGAQCIAGQCVSDTGCGMVGDRGCCAGDYLVECIDGKLWASNCNPWNGTDLEIFGPRCMWNRGEPSDNYVGAEWTIGTSLSIGRGGDGIPAERYVCAEQSGYDDHLVEEAPSGEHPRECDFTPCTKDCTGKSCGDDGCGGTCGGCGDHRDCVDHQCVDRIPEPTPDVVEPVDAADADEPDVVEPTDSNDTDDKDNGDIPAGDAARDDMTPDSTVDARHDVDTDIDDHTDTTPPADNVTEPEPSPGCGCSGSTAPAWPGSGVLFVLLLCLAAVVRARTQKR